MRIVAGVFEFRIIEIRNTRNLVQPSLQTVTKFNESFRFLCINSLERFQAGGRVETEAHYYLSYFWVRLDSVREGIQAQDEVPRSFDGGEPLRLP